jgi:CubicO group peptidase (beta-lactamase class C family)
MKKAFLLAVTTGALVAVAAAAQPGNIGQIKVGPVSEADIPRRFPSQIPGQIRANLLAQPASEWTVAPGALTAGPQVAANRIANMIRERFAGKSVGYSVTVIMPNGASAEANGGAARRAPDSAPRSWTSNDRLSIASVSKTITAAALVKLMAAKGLSLDIPAHTLLPPSWTYSPSFRTITVRELLSHNSGIRGCNITLEALRQCAASNIPAAQKNPGIPIWTKYSNANYALMRLIIPRVQDGSIPATAEQQGSRYQFLVNQFVFGPAGVGGTTCAPPAVNPALSYKSVGDNGGDNSVPQNVNFTNVQPGEVWGDMNTVCGSQGWNMSSRQLATFANALFFTDKILPQAAVNTMRSQGLGMMFFDFGNGLTAYGHGGYHPAGWNKGEVNTVILGFNNGVAVGVIINSRYNGNFAQDVADAVRAHTS